MAKKTTRREFLKTVALGSGIAFTGFPRRQTEGATPTPTSAFPNQPNFLILISDEERSTQYFPADWEAQNLPHLTRLKAHGITFTRAFCNSCMCSPSRATLFTGLYPAQHSVTDTLPEAVAGKGTPSESVLPPDLQNLAWMLKSAGYQVIYKGKWHLSRPEGADWTTADLERYGFDGWDPPDAGEDTDPENFGGGRANNDQRYTDDAVAFLKTVSGQQPFALIVSLINPHDVAGYPDSYAADYPANMLQGDLKLPPSVDENLNQNLKPQAQVELLHRLAIGMGALGTTTRQLEYLNFYGNLLQQVDRQMGQILDALEAPRENQAPLSENTLVLRLADHGEMGLSHGGLRQKMFVVYEEALRVPLIVSNPQLFPTPRRSDALVSLIDIMPTIATLAHVPRPEQWIFKGVDFSPLLLDPAQTTVQDAVYFTFDDIKTGIPNIKQLVSPPNRIHGLREKRWKYARYFDGDGRVAAEYELYDLEQDPQELENLAHPAHPRYHEPAIAAERLRLAQKLAAFEAEKLKPLNSGCPSIPGGKYPTTHLYPNYPNPFNPATRIDFQQGQAGLVKLAIYDMTGREIKVLVNDSCSVGFHSVVWDGTDVRGQRVASGIYACRLVTHGLQLTRWLTLAK